LVEAVRAGLVTESRLNESALRLLAMKFKLGLFDNPFVDPVRAGEVVGSTAFREAGLDAQRRSLVLLENRNGILPLRQRGPRAYLRGIDVAAALQRGLTVVNEPATADVAIVRIRAPHEDLHPGHFFGSRQHEGSLDFSANDEALELIGCLHRAVPTIVVVGLDRPAVLSGIQEIAGALIAEFGVSDEALLDVLTGRSSPQGRLPFELPASMADVEAQLSDKPHDLRRRSYPIFFGRSYGASMGSGD
jgi:beta-glucosidase